MTGAQGKDRSLVYNLTNLEINTIIKENLTARKMPDPANAILDVALTYAWKLNDLGFDLERWFRTCDGDEDARPPRRDCTQAEARQDLARFGTALERLAGAARETAEAALAESGAAGEDKESKPAGDLDHRAGEQHITVDASTFITLRWAAWIAARDSATQAGQSVLLDRIRQNSDQLKNLLLDYYGDPGFESVRGRSRTTINKIATSEEAAKRPLWELKPADMTTLRKIWEIGVQDVVAQTVIDLDGDSITYISRRYTAPSWGHILEVHRFGVTAAVGYWNNLMQALQRFLTDLIGLIGGGARRE